jgi:hypothetical protein
MRRLHVAAALSAVLLGSSCGSGRDDAGDPDAGGDGSVSPDGRDDSHDGAPGETYVTGTLEGDAFVLTYAAVDWGSVDKLCVSNVPVAAPDCGLDGQPKLLLYAWFAVNGDGGVWGLPEVELRDIGANVVELATDGWLDVDVYDPGSQQFRATLELTFPSGITRGTVAVP